MCIPKNDGLISAEEARKRYAYDPDTGLIVHVRASKSKLNGKSAVTIRKDGYAQVQVGRKSYRAHRLAWLLYYGVYPSGVVDHFNGNPSDNRISNLRDVSQMENLQNRTVSSPKSHTGLIGVVKDRGRYQARIGANGVQHYLGCFQTCSEAHAAYLTAKASLHGAFYA